MIWTQCSSFDPFVHLVFSYFYEAIWTKKEKILPKTKIVRKAAGRTTRFLYICRANGSVWVPHISIIEMYPRWIDVCPPQNNNEIMTTEIHRTPSTVLPERKPTICLIGAGRLATQLSIALQTAGYRISGIFSRTTESAMLLKQRLGGDGDIVATNCLQLLPACDIYIVAVADGAIESIVRQLPEQAKGGVVIHTAGGVAMSILANAAEHYGVLYPMQTFTKEKRIDFSQVYIFIEANDSQTLTLLRALGESLSPNVVELSSADRGWLHIGAVVACNFTNHLYDLAFSLLENHGIEPQCLFPLIDETVGKIREMSPRKGQTGPAVRGDMNVVNGHLCKLKKENPQLQQIYQLLTESILRRFGHYPAK